jgi:hypothetical protein
MELVVGVIQQDEVVAETVVFGKRKQGRKSDKEKMPFCNNIHKPVVEFKGDFEDLPGNQYILTILWTG